jgi:hypothetical protein
MAPFRWRTPFSRSAHSARADEYAACPLGGVGRRRRHSSPHVCSRGRRDGVGCHSATDEHSRPERRASAGRELVGPGTCRGCRTCGSSDQDRHAGTTENPSHCGFLLREVARRKDAAVAKGRPHALASVSPGNRLPRRLHLERAQRKLSGSVHLPLVIRLSWA